MKIRSRVQLRKSAKNKLMDELITTFGDTIKELKNSKFETALIDTFNVILIDGKLLLFSTDGEYFPTVRGAIELGLAKHIVVVDAGAVRFVVNGADIMCPGIVSADSDIKEGDLVIIKEETHSKPLAIGRALISGDAMVGESGKAIKSLHYVGDKLWNIDV
ncbi:MAG: RNA-binding protein [Methanosarcinaceae archaeon]|nr:RNA-binding protein [Methanosarcinaceae archaeon]